jgi:hypothetical protein
MHGPIQDGHHVSQRRHGSRWKCLLLRKDVDHLAKSLAFDIYVAGPCEATQYTFQRYPHRCQSDVWIILFGDIGTRASGRAFAEKPGTSRRRCDLGQIPQFHRESARQSKDFT